MARLGAISAGVLLALVLTLLSTRAFAQTSSGVAPNVRVYEVTLSQAPLSRLRLSFDHKGKGYHEEIEWDPVRSLGLSRKVYLRADADLTQWNVSVWSEPMLITAGDNAYYLRTEFYPCPRPATGEVPTDLASLTTDAGRQLCGQRVDLLGHAAKGNEGEPRISITLASGINGRTLDAAPALGLGGRGLDPVSGVASELLTVFAEIAMDRAKNGAFELVAKQLQRACRDLSWNDELLTATGAMGRKIGDPLLPETCKIFGSLRLQDIAASVETLKQAMLTDLTSLAISGTEGLLVRVVLENADLRLALRWSLIDIKKGLPADLADLQTALSALDASLAGTSAAPDIFGALIQVVKQVEKVGSQELLLKSPSGRLLRELSLLFGDVRHDKALTEALRSRGDRLAVLLLEATLLPAQREGLAKQAERMTKASDPLDQHVGKLLSAISDDLKVVAAPTSGGALDTAVDAIIFTTRALLVHYNKYPSRLDVLFGASLPTEVKQILQQFAAGDTLVGTFAAHWEALARALGIPDKAFVGWNRYLPKEFLLWQPILTRLGAVAVDAFAKGASPDRAAQLLLAELGRVPWADTLCVGDDAAATPSCVWACGAEVGFAVLDVCSNKTGGCSPTDVAEAIETGSGVLKPQGACAGIMTQLHTSWPDLDSLVLAGLEVLRPRPDATPKDIARSVVQIALDLLRRRQCADGETDRCLDMRDARVMILGVFDDRTDRVLTAAGAFLERALARSANAEAHPNHRKALLKLTRLAGAVTAYAATYSVDAKGDPEKLAEQHKARKEAIEGLIDATTDRTDRAGDCVWSIGVNVGFGVIGGQVPNSSLYYTQIELPLGVSWERLPAPPKEDDWGSGYHVGVSLLDIGQYAAFTPEDDVSKPSLATAISLGIQAGYLLGTPSSNLGVGLEARYAPALFPKEMGDLKGQDDVGAFRLGLYAAYYVPFFDLN